MLTHGTPPDFRDGVHSCIPPYAIGSVPSLSSTQLRTDGFHCRESVGTGPAVVEVVPVTGAAFPGLSFFPHPLLVRSESSQLRKESIGGTAWYKAVKYHTIPYDTMPYHTIRYHTIPYDSIRRLSTIRYHTIRYHAVPYYTKVQNHTIPYDTCRAIFYHTYLSLPHCIATLL